MSMIDLILNKALSNPNVQKNPMAQNVIRMYQNGDSQGLQQMCTNICKEQGTSVDEMRRKLGI